MESSSSQYSDTDSESDSETSSSSSEPSSEGEIRCKEKKQIEKDLDGKYVVERLHLGINYSNDTYVAKIAGTGRLVNIRKLGSDFDWGVMLEKEKIPEILNVDHLHIVNCFDWSFSSDRRHLYFVTEHFKYGTIENVRNIIDEKFGRTHLFEREISAVVKSILLSLRYLHKRNIVHSLVRADHCMVSNNGAIKLEILDCESCYGRIGIDVRRRGTMIGIPHWMSPEIITESATSETFKHDIWSLGITMIELAEGKPPLWGMNPMRALFMIPKRPSPVFKNPQQWSEEMNHFLSQILNKDPKKRPTASEALKHPWITGYFGDENEEEEEDSEEHIFVVKELLEKFIMEKDPRVMEDEKERIDFLKEEGSSVGIISVEIKMSFSSIYMSFILLKL